MKLSNKKELSETKKMVFNNEPKEVLFVFVNSEFTISDRFCSNPGNALEQAAAIIIFVEFNFVLNLVFV
jgi:hypothetical protein